MCVCVRVCVCHSLNGSSQACHLFSAALPGQKEDFAVLLDVINSDILHAAAGIMATPELQGDI